MSAAPLSRHDPGSTWPSHRHHAMHTLPGTTHTVEMSQISDLNRLLSGHQPLTAADLGLEGVARPDSHARGLSGTSVLSRVSWDGSPAFPFIYGHFASGPGGAELVVDLHTTALRRLSRTLAARHTWGVGSSPPTRPATS
jgi:hypothetical protein